MPNCKKNFHEILPDYYMTDFIIKNMSSSNCNDI